MFSVALGTATVWSADGLGSGRDIDRRNCNGRGCNGGNSAGRIVDGRNARDGQGGGSGSSRAGPAMTRARGIAGAYEVMAGTVGIAAKGVAVLLT